MVDLSLYEPMHSQNGELLAVSVLRRALIAEPRNVLQVDVGGDGRPRVRIERIPPGTSRQAWNEQQFLQHLEKEPSNEFKELARGLMALRDPFQLTATWGSGISPSLILKRNDKGIIELYLAWKSVGFRPLGFDQALGADVAESYRRQLAQLFPRSMSLKIPNVQWNELAPHVLELQAIVEHHLRRAA